MSSSNINIDGCCYDKVGIISDIHGDYEAFLSMVVKLNLTPNSLLIIAGDVIDRGYDSIKLIKLLIKDQMATFVHPFEFSVVIIKGNHEYMLEKHLHKILYEKDEATPYYYESTQNELEYCTMEELQELYEFLYYLPASATLIFGHHTFEIAHANPSLRKDDYEHIWGGDEEFYLCDEGYKAHKSRSKRIYVMGHIPTYRIRKMSDQGIKSNNSDIWINEYENVYLIDCGNGYKDEGGKLGALLIYESGKIKQRYVYEPLPNVKEKYKKEMIKKTFMKIVMIPIDFLMGIIRGIIMLCKLKKTDDILSNYK